MNAAISHHRSDRALASLLLVTAFLLWPNVTKAEPISLPNGRQLESVDFERHVMGLLSKSGCNNGSCHGSFQGRNGFRLSLFGLEPNKDHAALTRDLLGRRIDPIHSDRSLLLTKATGQTRHDGGARFGTDSWQYQVVRNWIAAGAVHRKGSGTVTALSVTPTEILLSDPVRPVAVTVLAQFADGSREEVTPFCDFRIQNDSVAEVMPLGQVRSTRPGDTALVVSYRGMVQAVRVLVPTPVPARFQYPQVPEVNFVDRAVFAKLRRLNMVPSDLASDTEFLRRLTIDTIGTLPTPDEVRAFLADPDPKKRDQAIDRLLAHPMHAQVWATKMSDITGNNTDALESPQTLKPRRSQMWHDWLARRFADNVPYDQLVRDILCATSRDELSPADWVEHATLIETEISKGFVTSYPERATLDLFWRRQQNVPIEQWGEKVAAAFLGVRLECAQCHKHPTDRWTQADYRAFANIFSPVTFGASPEAKAAIDAENAERKKVNAGKKNNQQIPVVREVFVAASGRGRTMLTHPETNQPLTPKALGGPEIPIRPGQDPRAALMTWMRSADNPFFARSFVNRVWAHYFGIGLVDPVDDFSVANPPTNPLLLDELAADFIRSGFDIRHLERTVLRSRTYQLSSTPNATNKHDRNNFARAYIRPLMAEVVVDVLNAGCGTVERFGNDAPEGRRMIEVGASRLTNPNLAYALRLFGRPPRTTACDCERAMEPALPQTLFRMTDPTLQAKLRPATNRLGPLLKSKKTDEQILEELFLATLSRFPTEEERQGFARVKADTADRTQLFTDTLWALINTREFILNH